MSELSAQIILRPVRIALLVRPNDAPSIRRFMRISACIWGGIYHPIIPVFRSHPKEWARDSERATSGYGVAKGYVDFFEPDIFVEAEPGLAEKIGLPKKQSMRSIYDYVFPLKALLKAEAHHSWATLKSGQSIIDVLRHRYDTERRFQMRDEKPAFEVVPDRGTSFVEAMFGAYPTEPTTTYFLENYKGVYRPEKVEATADLWRRVYLGPSVTPLSVTRHDIKPQRSWQNDLVIFIFDKDNTRDLIDLWNLRCEPNPILPVPYQWVEALAPDLARIINAEYQPLEGNPYGVMRHATVEFSRSLSPDFVDDILAALKSRLPKQKKKKVPGPLTVKVWRTPIWEASSGQYTPTPKRLELRVKDQITTLKVVENGKGFRTSFDAVAPEFAERYGGSDGVRWINTVRASNLGVGRIATLYPYNVYDRSWPRLSMATDETMIASDGWSIGQRYVNMVNNLDLMSQEQASIGALKKLGIEAVLSEPGHIAKQVLEHLGGLHGIGILADLDTMKMMNQMAGGLRIRTQPSDAVGQAPKAAEIAEELFDRRSKPIKDWIDLLAKRKERSTWRHASLEEFTSHNVLRLGIETNCPNCMAAGWHSIESAAYELVCERCLRPYSFPQAQLRPNNKNWAYRVIGPFSVPDYARGSYSALLAVRSLGNLVYSQEVNFCTALTLRFDGMEREVDYIVWHSDRSIFDLGPPRVIIGEAKSMGDGNLLTASDISKLKDVGEKIPGSMLAVSVLRDHFKPGEIDLLRRLVKWGRRPNSKGEPSNRVLLLTTNEKFDNFGNISARWKKLGGKFAEYADYHQTKSIENVAESTVAIYLDMPPFQKVQWAMMLSSV